MGCFNHVTSPEETIHCSKRAAEGVEWSDRLLHMEAITVEAQKRRQKQNGVSVLKAVKKNYFVQAKEKMEIEFWRKRCAHNVSLAPNFSCSS